jgi:AraC-like DNA-binding protein
MNSKIEDSRGILNPGALETKFRLSRYLPAQDLGYFVELYWIVTWDLRGQKPYLSEILPYPCVHLVLQKDKSAIVGVVKRKFTRRLEGKDWVFGVKFRPGAFYPFIKSPVSNFTNRSLTLQEVFGVESQALETAILSLEDEAEMVKRAEGFLRERLPERDETVELINRITDRIMADREITRVDDLVNRFNLSKRTLQRLFNQYVGAGPKWVIKQYRLQEAAVQLAAGEAVDGSRLAQKLGYFDQAHFIKDFKTTVGSSPAEYAKNMA